MPKFGTLFSCRVTRQLALALAGSVAVTPGVARSQTTNAELHTVAARRGMTAADADWKLVWSDEFNQPDGSLPDPAKWSFETGGHGWGNGELEYYTARTNNARIEDGHLVIEARRENLGGKSFTSARLLTQGKGSWTYGRIEARIQIPRGQGLWPAFWMLGTNVSFVGWPACGEIDIMENIGQEPGTVHGTVHGPGYSGSHGIGGPCTLPRGAALANDFHVYGIEWTTNRLNWYIDGQTYYSITPARLPPAAPWAFDQSKFVILNLAVGGGWPGNPDATTTFPRRLLVDYVRVYQQLPSTVKPAAVAPAQAGSGH